MPETDQLRLFLTEFRSGLLAFLTAFIVALLVMPLLMRLIRRYRLFDLPDARKEHQLPIPTMGGIASCTGLVIACLLWYPFGAAPFTLAFFLCLTVLFALGILDDMRNIPARYKLGVQLVIAAAIAASGTRMTDLEGLLGIHQLPVFAQYLLTIVAIAGITNAFNLIDGIDGLAGGLGFMSLSMAGLFLTQLGDARAALVAFALAGGVLGFLYFNLTPARIFMGDTGSLVLGFVLSVLCIRLMEAEAPQSVLPQAPVFVLSLVLVPVFDTLRVFAIRLWQGRSPFSPDRNHIHHILTGNGWSHRFTARAICAAHAGALVAGYLLNGLPPELALAVLFLYMLTVVALFRQLRPADK